MGFSLKKLIAPVGAALNFPLVSGALAAGADTAVGLYNAKKDREAMRDANTANINLANAQMAFQERLSSSSHQREVEDLKKAGLNPVLSANSGASTPSGSITSVDPLPSPMKSLAPMTSALETARFVQDVRESNSRIDANQAMAASTLGGTPFKTVGADAYRAVRRVLSKISQSAKHDFDTFPRSKLDFQKKFKTSPMKRIFDYIWPGGEIKTGRKE